MDLITELQALGVNTDEAVARFLNNEALYKKMLLKFPANIEKLPVMPAVAEGDYETALANAHTIKGVAGNLSLTPLYTAYTEIVDLFRKDQPEAAAKLLEQTLPVQESIVSCISRYI